MAAAFAFTTASHFTLGELGLDDASTFFVALRPWREVLTLPITFQSQPPLFYLALHLWLRMGDSEPVLRALPLVFMAGAGATLLSASSLPRRARIVAALLLLLTSYSDYLTSALRPYSLSVWLALWSCLWLASAIREPRRSPVWYAGYVVVTALMAYSVAMASWTLVAQGLCAVVVFGVTAARSGVRTALARHAALLLSLAAVGVLYVPFAVTVWRAQGHAGDSSLSVMLAASVNPRYFVSGPLYLLTLPGRLGYLAVAAAVAGVWSGARRRDELVGVLVTVVLVQIALTHGFLEGRSPFSFRYLAPAYPALCLLAGLGADRWLARVRAAGVAVAACAALILVVALVSFVRAPHDAPIGPWRQVRADLLRWPGPKVIFFDVGWDAQRLQYEVQHDANVRIMSDPGTGWATGGRLMTPDYVNRVIAQESGSASMFFYEFDPVLDGRVFASAFAPGMAQRGCARVYQREVPTYSRDVAGDTGALLYGYACHGD